MNINSLSHQFLSIFKSVTAFNLQIFTREFVRVIVPDFSFYDDAVDFSAVKAAGAAGAIATGAGGATYLPGNVAGSTDGFGVYA